VWNVKITHDGVVKVLDFGLATVSKGMIGGDAAVPPTEAGLIVGTPGYMAPEQARGERIDGRADIWAFGAILWEMLTGRQLFEGTTTSATLAAVLTREPDLSVVPLQVRRLLRLYLARDPGQRLRQISAVLLLLEEGEPLPTPGARPVARWLRPAAFVLFLAAAALVFVHYRDTGPDPVMIRLRVPLPEKVIFGGHLSVSPDGRHICSAEPAAGQTLILPLVLDFSHSRIADVCGKRHAGGASQPGLDHLR
jgi:serine/threonine protein kinase